MHRASKKIAKKVTLLTDPQPAFNSIVTAGANGTPLRVIKSDELSQEAEMPKNLKHGNADIARLVFRGDKFKTEEQVQAWLTAGNYVDTTVQKQDDAFVVEGSAVKDEAEIEVEDGVTAFVGEAIDATDDTANADVTAVNGQKSEAPKTGAQKDEDAELYAEAEEKCRTEAKIEKADWDKLQPATKDKFVAPVLAALKAEKEAEAAKAAEEGKTVEAVQPVATEAAETTDAPALPSLLAKQEDGTLVVVSQKSGYEVRVLTEVISSLSYLKSDAEYEAFFAGNGSGPVADNLRVVIKQLGEILIAVAAATVEQAAKSDEAPAATTEATGETQKTEAEANAAKADETAAGTSNSGESDVLIKALQALTETVNSLKTELAEERSSREKSVKKADELAERLSKVEQTAPTRKSADVEDMPSRVSPIHQPEKQATKSAQEISAEVRHQSSLSALGIRT